MLSICIPTYNYCIIPLVKELHLQAASLGIPFEIRAYDDASSAEWKALNEALKQMKNVNYIELPNNIGRSKIRNLLAAEALYPNLIFMDCDSRVVSASYLADYIPYFDKQLLAYGGRCYTPQLPDTKHALHWKYGTCREAIPAHKRSTNPHKSFMTNNFLIPKAMFETIQFDESLQGYGHEDTLFGIELLRHQIPIVHIQNPLEHAGLETSAEFLQKTENGIDNLLHIYRNTVNPEPLIHKIKLLRTYAKLSPTLVLAFKWIFRILKPVLRGQLLSKWPSLWVFDLYKLGYMCGA